MTTWPYSLLTAAQALEAPHVARFSAASLMEDLSAAGQSGIQLVGGHEVLYVAGDQLVSEGLPLLLHHQAGAPRSDTQQPDPKTASAAALMAGPQMMGLRDPKQSLLILMQRLRASGIHPWVSAANDWFSKMKFADMFEWGRMIIRKLEQERPALIKRIDPDHSLRDNINRTQPSPRTAQEPQLRPNSSARGGLKLVHTADTQPQPTMSIASNFVKRRIEHRVEDALFSLLPAA